MAKEFSPYRDMFDTDAKAFLRFHPDATLGDYLTALAKEYGDGGIKPDTIKFWACKIAGDLEKEYGGGCPLREVITDYFDKDKNEFSQ